MRKLLTLALLFGLGLALVSGCQTQTSTAEIPESVIASGMATSATNALTMDNDIDYAAGGIGIAGASSAMDVIASAITFTRDGDWFTGSDSFTTGGMNYDRNINFRVWDYSGVEVTTVAGLQTMTPASKLQTYSTIDYTFSGGNYNISYGLSKSDPLTFTYPPNPKSIDGPIQYTSTYGGSSFAITFDYGNLTLSASGYPLSGSIDWAVYSNNTEIAAGSLTFSGTQYATLTFTSGGSGTYTINMQDGSFE